RSAHRHHGLNDESVRTNPFGPAQEQIAVLLQKNAVSPVSNCDEAIKCHITRNKSSGFDLDIAAACLGSEPASTATTRIGGGDESNLEDDPIGGRCLAFLPGLRRTAQPRQIFRRASTR